MARSRKKTTKKKQRGRLARTAGLLALAVRRLRVPLGLAAFGFGLFLAIWTIRLDRIVVDRFDGRIFHVPSQVLSEPSILYPGLDWQRADLRGTLARLGYRGVHGVAPAPGQYEWTDRRVRLHLRAFDHPTRGEPARKLELGLAGSRVTTLTAPNGRPLGAVPLEPEPVGLYYGPDREQRELVRLEDLPPALIDAILAVEDQRFPSHKGVDPRRIAGAQTPEGVDTWRGSSDRKSASVIPPPLGARSRAAM